MSKKIQIENAHLKKWIEENTASDPFFVEVDNGLQLTKAIKNAGKRSLVAIVPAKPNEKWWIEVVGNVNPYVFFMGKESKEFPDKAVVIYNPKYKIPVIPDGSEIVHRLIEEYGISVNRLSKEIGKARSAIYRIRDTSTEPMIEQRLDNIAILYDLLQELEKGTKTLKQSKRGPKPKETLKDETND